MQTLLTQPIKLTLSRPNAPPIQPQPKARLADDRSPFDRTLSELTQPPKSKLHESSTPAAKTRTENPAERSRKSKKSEAGTEQANHEDGGVQRATNNDDATAPIDDRVSTRRGGTTTDQATTVQHEGEVDTPASTNTDASAQSRRGSALQDARLTGRDAALRVTSQLILTGLSADQSIDASASAEARDQAAPVAQSRATGVTSSTIATLENPQPATILSYEIATNQGGNTGRDAAVHSDIIRTDAAKPITNRRIVDSHDGQATPTFQVDRGRIETQPHAAGSATVQSHSTIVTSTTHQPQPQPESESSSSRSVTVESTQSQKQDSSAGAIARAIEKVQAETKEASSPAVTRAARVDAAIALENATGQSTSGDGAAKPTLVSTIDTSPIRLATPGAIDLAAGTAARQQSSAASDDLPIANQVVRGLSTMVNQRGGVMSMRLDPPDLGELRVRMTITRGVVSAEFQPTTPQAQGLLDRTMATLRAALENQGLSVERLVVHASPTTQQQSMRDDSGGNPSSHHRQQHDAAGGESRGRRDGAFADDQSRRFNHAWREHMNEEAPAFATH